MIRVIKRILVSLLIFKLSIIANIVIKIIPFKKLINLITNCDFVEVDIIDSQLKTRLLFILEIIEKIAFIVPWRVKCFEQALIFLVMAHILKVNVNIYFGVLKDEQDKVCAHAWTMTGGYTWTGFEEAADFTPVYIRGYKANQY